MIIFFKNIEKESDVFPSGFTGTSISCLLSPKKPSGSKFLENQDLDPSFSSEDSNDVSNVDIPNMEISDHSENDLNIGSVGNNLKRQLVKPDLEISNQKTLDLEMPDLKAPSLDSENSPKEEPSCSKTVQKPCEPTVPVCPVPIERKRRTIYRKNESKIERKKRKERLQAAVEKRKEKLRSLKKEHYSENVETTNLLSGPILFCQGDRHGPFAGRPR